ncbi:MAG: hypothetical protein QXY18_03095 [Nitrososphaerota archaeon]|nr:hypothetical protein [Candidatus Aenigmarchaeota archaeon]
MFNPIKWIKETEDKAKKIERVSLLVFIFSSFLWCMGVFFGAFFKGFSILMSIGSFIFFIGIIIYLFAQYLELKEK